MLSLDIKPEPDERRIQFRDKQHTLAEVSCCVQSSVITGGVSLPLRVDYEFSFFINPSLPQGVRHGCLSAAKGLAVHVLTIVGPVQ